MAWQYSTTVRKMHLLLFKTLSAELNREGMTVWNATAIRRKLQVVANLFLLYHGFRVSDDAPVFVCAESAGFATRTTRPFYFYVAIREPVLLLRAEDGVMPTSAEVALVERALAWVLRTLALDGDRVGLRRPAFG